MFDVARYVMQSLKVTGIDTVFGYPGQSNLALLHAACDVGMRYVQASDERGAAYAAAGYIQASACPAIVCVSKGPAMTNLLTPMMAAMKDGIPIVALTGNACHAQRGQNSFQEFDPCSTFACAGAVKRAEYCAEAAAVPDALNRVYAAAWEEPFGPALLDIPENVSTNLIDAHPRALGAPRRVTWLSPPARRATLEVAELLKQSSRPVLIVGAGARHDYEIIRSFSAVRGIPVVHTMGGTGVVSTDSPVYGGLLRHNGSRKACYLVHQADLLIALGTGVDERATGIPHCFAPNAKKVHVDLDGVVLRRRGWTVPVEGCIEGFLRILTGALGAGGLHYGPWLLDLLKWQDTERRSSPALGRLRARDVIEAAADAIKDGIITKDSGSHKYWITNLAPCTEPSRVIASCHFGAMGFGLPAAIGASIARPRDMVIAMCGDGGSLMALSELRTAATEECRNLKIMVFNNAGLGSTRDYEVRLLRGVRLSNFRTRMTFASCAASMGIESYSIASRVDLAMLSAQLRRPGLMLFDCLIDPSEEMRPSISYSSPLIDLLNDPLAPATDARTEGVTT